jgi:hypothetical protein
MVRRYARAPKGKRAYGNVPRNCAKNTTLLASMKPEGMGPCLVGSTTKETFEAYVEYFLAPMLREGQVAVLDNLSWHKGERVRELIEAIGRTLSATTPEDAEGWFLHCGYQVEAQGL